MYLKGILLTALSLSGLDQVPIESQDANTDILNAHNAFRAKHGAAPLKWSNTLAGAAQKWVNGCNFKHSGGAVGHYGENLAAGTGGFNGVAGVKMWTDEVKDYNPRNPQPSHFTQVVWKSTKEVGCAMKVCPNLFDGKFRDAKMLVCEYNPPGNVIGQFPQNVQK
ncbi:PR-1-like protein [Marasmius fiardii PR-910]|nr:PR-1-like protein [Marasmius fiardii PR-910]